MNESTNNIITLLVKITCINNTYIEKEPNVLNTFCQPFQPKYKFYQ